MYKVKQSDLIGDIKGFPIEVVQKMVELQVEQGNKADIFVFQKRRSAGRSCGGFDFDSSIEGQYFWNQVINIGNFDIFYERYHSKNVYYRGVEGRGDEIIEALEKLGGKIKSVLIGETESMLYFITSGNEIIAIDDDSTMADILQRGFTELFLPEIETVEIDGKKFRKDEVMERINGLKEIK